MDWLTRLADPLLSGVPLPFLLVAFLSTLLLGLGKSGFGGGIGVIAVPLMLLAKPEEMAAPAVSAILLPVLCVADAFTIYHYRHRCNFRNLGRLLPGALAGIGLGSLFLFQNRLGDAAFKLAIGILALGFVVDQFIRGWILRKVETLRPSMARGSVFGLIAGFGSTLAHAGGPPVAMFLLPQREDRHIFVGTTVFFFTLINAIKLIPYYFAGHLDFTNIRISILLIPFVPVGVYLGLWLIRRMKEGLFRSVVYTLLFLTAVKLVYDGVLALY